MVYNTGYIGGQPRTIAIHRDNPSGGVNGLYRLDTGTDSRGILWIHVLAGNGEAVFGSIEKR